MQPGKGRRGEHAANDAKRADRNAAIWERRKDGWTLQRIADHFGIGTSTVDDVCRKYLDKPREIAREALALELARNAELLEAWRLDARTDPKVLASYLRVVEQRHKLLGLYTTRIVHDGQIDSGPVVDLRKLETEEVRELQRLLAKGKRDDVLAPAAAAADAVSAADALDREA